jgi:hypothetical protein
MIFDNITINNMAFTLTSFAIITTILSEGYYLLINNSNISNIKAGGLLYSNSE